MASTVRKRKSAPDGVGDHKRSTQKGHTSKGKSHSGLLIILFVMVIVVWAVAATAYFGIIDYKALIVKTSSISSTSSNSSYLSRLLSFPLPNFSHPFRNLGMWLIKADEYLSSFFEVKGLDGKKKVERSFKEDKANIKSDQNPDNVQSKSSKTAGETNSKKTMKKDQSSEAKTVKKSNDGKKKKSAKGRAKEPKPNLSSLHDQPILKELARGEELLTKKKGNEAFQFFKKLFQSNPDSPRAMFGKARSLLIQSDEQRSNQLLQEGIDALGKIGEQPHCPIALEREANLLKIDKQLFLGRMRNALQTASALYKKIPKDLAVLNKLGVCYLYMGKNPAAKKVYEQALVVNPNDGFAQVHYGFIVKAEGDWSEGAKYLRLGIESMEEGTQQGKFYMHLGDALHRLNRTAEANEFYQLGADRGFFKSKYQRSLYNVDRLQSRPYWTAKEAKVTNYVQALEKNWKLIRDEALSIMNADKGLFLPEEESLKNTGDWKQLTLFARGKRLNECKRLPKTCAILDRMPNAIGCTRGQIKFSIMAPGTHVWAHTGPTNCRLRMHLGLVIPKTGEGAKIRCADMYKTWEEGKVLIFDDSFEHEVWQNAESHRLILIVDVWHPDLTEREKKTLSPI